MSWVDSQCHVSPIWYEPVEVLLGQMERHGVGQAVLIQMLGQTDNDYQQACLERFPGRFSSVVMVDADSEHAVARLVELAERGAGGVRLRPAARSPGTDPLAIWRTAADLGLAVSCVGNAAGFSAPEFAHLIEALPRLIVVLEHLGGTSQPDADEAARAARSRVLELARFPNVYLKVPGLGELQPRKAPLDAGSAFGPEVPELLVRALSAFGPQRLMWGSDFPPVSAREGYGNALTRCRDALQQLRRDDLQDMFAGVARRIFKLPDPKPV